jgi:hypothetical protein
MEAAQLDLEVESLSYEPPEWEFRLSAGPRTFEVGASGREALFVSELVGGKRKAIFQPSSTPFGGERATVAFALQAVKHALENPGSLLVPPVVI